jgi:monovalent cation:H+ antiporter-2, CPA2 family
MELELHSLKIVIALTIGFSIAGILGFITHKLRLSPILGYLLAGYLIGPFSPGFITDMELSEQLAEIGVVLMMFGVGMHFKLEDLIKVKNIAITGGLGQTLIASVVGTLLIYMIGFPLEIGLIIGLAISVASTVVLVRVLSDNNLLDTTEGHVAVGWLIVEDIFTVAILILLPIYAEAITGMGFSLISLGSAIGIIIFKFTFLILIMFTVGKKIVSYVLFNIARTRSHELLTLGVLALTFAIATGSTLVFGTSIALGAFIAGMVIGQTDIKHQAAANSLPIRDAFVVLFFLSVGMLFNPMAIWNHLPLFLCVLGVILFVKPIAAFLIVTILRYPFKTALTVALALAQIGEFSFILAEEAMKLKILPEEAYDIIVACALISISINPLVFRTVGKIHMLDPGKPHIHNDILEDRPVTSAYQASVIGYGPIGLAVTEALEKMGFECLIIERNIDTVTKLQEQGKVAIFGDFTQPNIMEIAEIESTNLLIITVPEIETAQNIIQVVRQYNPSLPIIARATFASDKILLESLKVECVCSEEETAHGFNELIKKIVKNCFPEKILI